MITQGLGLWEQLPKTSELDYIVPTKEKTRSFLDMYFAIISKQIHGEFFYLFPKPLHLPIRVSYRLKGKNYNKIMKSIDWSKHGRI